MTKDLIPLIILGSIAVFYGALAFYLGFLLNKEKNRRRHFERLYKDLKINDSIKR